MTPEQTRAHIVYKAQVRELAQDVAHRMLDALDSGAAPDYAALLEAATFINPPPVCYHTAPVGARDRIFREGLRAGDPADGPWGAKAAGQARGVYVTREPDVRGVWTQEATWDVWAVTLGVLPWEHDRLNPGCYVLPADVPAAQVRLTEQLPEYLLICNACQSSLRTSDPEKIAKHEADHADCGLMDAWEDFLGGGQ